MTALIPPREVGKVVNVGNLTVGGTALTSAQITDIRIAVMTQTTASLTFILPNPEDLTVVYSIDIVNNGTVSFLMYGVSVAPNTFATFDWNGTSWVGGPSSFFKGYFTVANLPTTGLNAGNLAYATNGRAQTGVITLGAATVQGAGAGTGCLVSWCAATGTTPSTAWQIVGTTITVTA